MRVAMLGGLAAMALALVACGGGGSSGSVKYAATVVPIKHLDLSSTDLSVVTVLDPPFADQYPTVVATVNGQTLSGSQLASEEMELELNRRSLTPEMLATFPELGTRPPADPLDWVISDAVQQQAVERLGLLPTRDEAIAFARQRQSETEAALAQMTPGDRARTMDRLRAEGFPSSDWGSDDRAIQFYRQDVGTSRLRSFCARNESPNLPTEDLSASIGPSTCSRFLANERKHADVVYYVRWAD